MPRISSGLEVKNKIKARMVALGALVVILAIGVGVWYWSTLPRGAELVAGNGYEKSVEELLKQPLPKDPAEQVYYYGQLGQNYDALRRYDKAVGYYLKAQAVIDAHDLSARMAFYDAISEDYRKLRNNQKADEYHKKAQERMQKYANQNPPEQSTTVTLGGAE